MRALAGGEPICSLPRISDLREREAVSLRREVSFVLGYPLSYEGMEPIYELARTYFVKNA
mgnify:CR=1 FL=1